jgi:hypothetical protein
VACVWEEQLEAAYARLAGATGATHVAGRQERWERGAGLHGEARLAWKDVRRELAYAGTAGEAFLPADAQWLALRAHRYYQQIVFATERAWLSAEALA